MLANSHAYNTVFTVYSLPVHGPFGYYNPVRAIRSGEDSRSNLFKFSIPANFRLKNPAFLKYCRITSHSSLPENSSPLSVFQASNHPAVSEKFLGKHRSRIGKMRLGKARRIAYIWHTMHDAIKDEQLMLQYKDGDSRAFEILYSRYRLPMFRYLQNQCGNAAIAEEIFQDVWMNLVRARERYQVTASFKTYIYRLAHNRLIDHYRKQKHGVPSSYDEHEGLLNMEETANHISPQRHVAVEQQVDRLLEAIAQLPEAQREAFLLKEETGLSVEEIAAMTDVKPETAKSRIRYAMNKLKEAVEIEHYA